MKIAVCIKQVPDNDSRFSVKNDKLDESSIAYRVNEFDMYAVEEAVRIKEKFGGEVVTFTAGTLRAESDIRRCFALGADRGLLLDDIQVFNSDPLTVASIISSMIKKTGEMDLVLCGVMSEDEMSGVMPSMLASILGIPCCSAVTRLDIDMEQGMATAVRELDAGERQIVEFRLPAVVSIQSGINIPRYPALPAVIQSKKKRLDILNLKDIENCNMSIPVSKTELLKMYLPEKKGGAEMITGTASESAAMLVEKIRSVMEGI